MQNTRLNLYSESEQNDLLSYVYTGDSIWLNLSE